MKTLLWPTLGGALVASIVPLAAQSLTWDWTRQIGGPDGGVITEHIGLDPAGHPLAAGYFTGTAVIGPDTLVAESSQGAFVARLRPDGTVAWARGSGGWAHAQALGVAADAAGNVYVTGSFDSSLAFGSAERNSRGGEDVFLAKFSPAGDLLWLTSGGGTSMDGATDLAIGPDGTIYLTGFFNGTATFGSVQLISAGGADIFVLACSPAGDFLWGARAGSTATGAYSDVGQAIGVTPEGKIVVAGRYRGLGRFGTLSVSSAGQDDIFVAQLDPATRLWEWVARGGGSRWDEATHLAIDAAGNIVVAGEFQGSANFSGAPLTSDWTGGDYWESDYFVAQYSPTGALNWVRKLDGTGYFGGGGLGVDGASNIYFAGTFNGQIQLADTTRQSEGIDNVFVAKMSPDGEPVWLEQAAGDFFHVAHGLAVNAEGELFLATRLNGNARFGEKIVEQSGLADTVVAKFGLPRQPGGGDDGDGEDLSIHIDIRPGSAVNPLQVRSRGVVPVAILGSDVLNVREIDRASLGLWRADGVGGVVAPVSKGGTGIEDVAGIDQTGPDGRDDLVIRFSTAEMVGSLELADLPRGTKIELVVSGALQDGTLFSGSGTIEIR